MDDESCVYAYWRYMHNKTYEVIEGHPVAPWMEAFPELNPLFLAYRQVGGRYRRLEPRHPASLRVPIALNTPVTIWHWCLMHSLSALTGKHRLARKGSTRAWLPEFQARYSSSRPYEQPFHSHQNVVHDDPDDPQLSPVYRRASHYLHMYAFPFGKSAPADAGMGGGSDPELSGDEGDTRSTVAEGDTAYQAEVLDGTLGLPGTYNGSQYLLLGNLHDDAS